MQIVEKSHFGLRSAQIRLICEGKPDFVILPMMHVASEAFFLDVRERANACDHVLIEGVRSPKAAQVVPYKKVAKGVKNGLYLQSWYHNREACPEWENADIDRDEFDKLLARTPLWVRMLFFVARFILPIYIRNAADLIRRTHSIEDNHSREDRGYDLEESFGSAFSHLIMTRRDQILAQRCDQLISERKVKSIAVIWGAAHVRVLVRHLIYKQGYSIRAMEWMTLLRRQ